VLVIVVAALGGAIAWLSHRAHHYQATADVLFIPIPSDNQGASGLPVLRDSSDPTRLSQTAASLLDTPQASVIAAKNMGRGWTPSRIREAVSVEPQGQSDIIAVTAKSSSAAVAQRLANTFVTASLAARRALLQSEAASLTPLIKAQVLPGDVIGEERRSLLSALAQGQDPNFSLSQAAERPSSPTDTAAWLVLALSLLAGFALGSGAAVVTELVSDRVRDTDELLSLYRLPVLAYIPALPRRWKPSPDGVASTMPLSVVEAFRMIRVQLDTKPQLRSQGGRAILITSGSSGDGKTTSAAAIARSLAEAGHRVIAIDLDLRKPDLGPTLHAAGDAGVTSLLDGRPELSHALIETAVPRLSVLPAGAGAGEQLLRPLVGHMPILMEQLRTRADYMVIDTPPLGEVSDAYQLLPFVDEVIVVARPGNTRRASFQFMSDLLARANHAPLGMIVIGETGHHTDYYYGQSGADRSRLLGLRGRSRA